jgi:arylsulfatase
MPGRSLVAAFARDDAPGHKDLWWAHEGNRAVRAGDWKLVAARDRPWELYDLATDRTETHNRAADNPAKVAELSALWQRRMDEFTAIARVGDGATDPASDPVKP